MTTIVVPEAEAIALYSMSDAAHIIDVPAPTFAGWARGYEFKTLNGRRSSPALITTTGRGRYPSVPFVGLAEGYVLAAFRAAGVPMQRIRPAVDWLTDQIGMDVALASERLLTDGAEVLYDFGQSGDAAADSIRSLVVVRNQQYVFNEIVERYLQTITFEGGLVARFGLPKFGDAGVSVDPRINSGQPTVTSRGIRVADIVTRIRAGEALEDVAYDYDINKWVVSTLNAVA